MAIDTQSNGRPVTDAAVRSQISDRLTGLPSQLSVHVGQLVLLTVNRRGCHAGFVNGSLAVVVELAPTHAPTETVVRLLDEPDDAPTLRVRRIEATANVGGAEYTRLAFPIIPAYAMTIHRVGR
jgi:hypothetical protein